MIVGARLLAALSVLWAIGAVTGCSTASPLKTGRSGLLEDLNNGGTRASSPGSDLAIEEDGKAEELRPAVASWGLPLRHFQVTSNYGKRGRSFHEGVDLRAARGTSVYAVQSGRVIYASRRISGYGNMVVIKHGGGLSTVYAHCSRLLVRVGQRVSRGQQIALSGSTGHSSGPHLHFEIRHGISTVDPVRLLSDLKEGTQEARRSVAAR